jgi:hypothetical protein
VQSFPVGSGEWQVSTNFGFWPRWRRDGRELFYMDSAVGGKLLAVDVKANGPTFNAGTPRELFATGYVNLPAGGRFHPYAVAADGQRFLIPRPEQIVAETTLPIVAVLNWAEGLKK